MATLVRTAMLAFAVAACAHATQSGPTTGDPRVDRDLERLRAATRAYQNIDSAVAAGYVREVRDCIVHEHHGAMGYHHINRSFLAATPTIERPSFLLYDRTPDGTYRLNGVEFIVPYRLYSRDSTPPVLFGQKFHHEDNFNYWYLHVWAWTNNPEGMFANFNPAVTCPSEAAKVYKAFSRDSL
jgi:hypothetical protein